MPSSSESLICYIRRLAGLPPEEATNVALLDRFVTRRDEQAFTALVKRHGAMVLQVCSRILGNGAHAEDAFQATFLVLARKAGAVKQPESLPAWLHGVARRISLKARAARARQNETGPLLEAPADKRADPLAEISARELLTIIDEEVQRLPARYRLAVILCCLGESSVKEAARQLGWSSGTVKGCLERGRARLQAQLIRRGLTFSAALAALEVSRATTSAAVLARLAARTIPGALAFGQGPGVVTGISASAAALAGRFELALALPKLMIAVVLLLTTAALGAGIAFHDISPESWAPPRAQDSSPSADTVALQRPSESPTPALGEQSDVPIDVGGRVLDPHGKPLAGAELYVGYSVPRLVRQDLPEKPFVEQARPDSYPRRATTDADGRFHFRFATSELDASKLDDARPAVMATAEGYGPEWLELGPSTMGDLKLQLVEDLPANGRVLDANGRPVAGAKLVVQAIYSAPAEELARYLGRELTEWAPRCWKGPLPGKAPTIVTGVDGRWSCGGLGRDRVAAFTLEGSRVPRTCFNVANRLGVSKVSAVHDNASDYVAPTVHTIRGVVRDQATKQPIAGVKVSVVHSNSAVHTGPDGQFEIHDSFNSRGYDLVAQPETGQGYFANQVFVRAQDGVAESSQDLFLVRGVALSGRVTNQSTGMPPKTAVVQYYPLDANPHSHLVNCGYMIPASTAAVRSDGSYSLVVLPGPGVIAGVASPREDYALTETLTKEWSEFMRAQRGRTGASTSAGSDPGVLVALGEDHYPGVLQINNYHAIALINPPEEAQSQLLDLPLRTAQSIHGLVLGLDGQPLNGVEVVGLSSQRESKELLEGASFKVTGLNQGGSRELLFQHRSKGLCKVVTLRGDAAQPLSVQLEHCGAVHGRLVDENGNPIPGAYVYSSANDNPARATARTDDLGRFHMALVPGHKYSWPAGQWSNELPTLRLGAGQIRDLGDLTKRQHNPQPKIPEPKSEVSR